MSAINDILAIQAILGVSTDGDIGKITTSALRELGDRAKTRAIQLVLARATPALALDGIVGPRTMAALAALDELGDIESLEESRPLGEMHHVKASSFADLNDLQAFRKCKAAGNSDRHCFARGDNGIGKWGHHTAQEHTPMAALPREVWRDAGKTGGALLRVTYRGKTVDGILGDTMPALANIRNGAGIDLNPAFAKAFDLTPPFLVDGVTWEWA